jgi:hypothetical protein
MYPKIASLLIIAAIALLSCSSLVLASAEDTPLPHLMSGYVLDSSGCGIAGAEIRRFLEHLSTHIKSQIIQATMNLKAMLTEVTKWMCVCIPLKAQTS